MIDFEVPVKLKRSTAGTYVRGRLVPGQETVTDIMVSKPQSLRGNQVLLLPENRRTEESYTVYTDVILRANDESSNKLPCDVITYNGKDFEVHNVKNWLDTDIPHIEAVIIRKEIVDNYAPLVPPEEEPEEKNDEEVEP